MMGHALLAVDDHRGLLVAADHRGFLLAADDCRGVLVADDHRDFLLAAGGCRGFASMAGVALRDLLAVYDRRGLLVADNHRGFLLAADDCRGLLVEDVALRDAVELAEGGCRGLLADHGCRTFARMAKEVDYLWLVVVVGSSRRCPDSFSCSVLAVWFDCICR
jgi:hypothetical protein